MSNLINLNFIISIHSFTGKMRSRPFVQFQAFETNQSYSQCYLPMSKSPSIDWKQTICTCKLFETDEYNCSLVFKNKLKYALGYVQNGNSELS